MKVDPSSIRFKISPHHDLNGTQGGDWDLERRHSVRRSAKHRSIIARYSKGMAWEDTPLFRDLYQRRFDKGESIRGEATMKGLLAQYYGRVDAMFEDMKANGFAETGALPKLLIGRKGEVFIGNQGNHRLAMAHVLKLKRIVGVVLCWHRLFRQ